MSCRSFDGAEPKSVKMFLFYFKNASLREKPDVDKAHELMASLGGPVFQFSFTRFVKDGKLTKKGMNYKTVKWPLIERYEDKERSWHDHARGSERRSQPVSHRTVLRKDKRAV